jgi:leucyl-tRNA synthetase
VAEGFSILLRVLSPIAPHICHALWCELGYGSRHPRCRTLARAGLEAALAQDEAGTRVAGQWQASRQPPRESRR